MDLLKYGIRNTEYGMSYVINDYLIRILEFPQHSPGKTIKYIIHVGTWKGFKYGDLCMRRCPATDTYSGRRGEGSPIRFVTSSDDLTMTSGGVHILTMKWIHPTRFSPVPR